MILTVHHLCNYHPTKIYGTKNPLFDCSRESKLLLDLKDSNNPNHTNAVRYFAGKLNSYLAKIKYDVTSASIGAVVPSSSQGQYSKGLERLLLAVQGEALLNVQPGLIVRQSSIVPLHKGGPRDIGIQLASLRVNTNLINDNNRVLLIDDVTTTGITIDACAKLLEKSGVKELCAIAVGKTTYG